MENLLSSLRLVLVTMIVCCVLYTGVIWGVGAAIVPDRAAGSLLHNADGQVIGSSLIAQKFTRPEYFWPRPSAVDYNAAATGGSNLSPLNPAITERAEGIIARLDLPAGERAPADLVTASGSGMDPHLSQHAALAQTPRVAAARGVAAERVVQLVERLAASPEGIGLTSADARIVNVLLLNLALDRQFGQPQ